MLIIEVINLALLMLMLYKYFKLERQCIKLKRYFNKFMDCDEIIDQMLNDDSQTVVKQSSTEDFKRERLAALIAGGKSKTYLVACIQLMS